MTFSRKQKIEAYKKLPPEVQDFVMSNETTELIENYLKETGLSEDQSISADSEILYAMYGLQTLSEAVENIAKLSGKNINDLVKLKKDLDNNILKNIPQEKSTNNIGQSFEDIILNQARAMQPARLAGESGRVTSHEVRDTNKVPENLPTEQEKSKVIHNYIGDKDPYREPLQ